ncbi:MAG TPA: ABC transporter permease subunit [Xanthobacteraceae bacterium]|nr:ABC transporter permease subunit [Xanthobacteraceae bacterium]
MSAPVQKVERWSPLGLGPRGLIPNLYDGIVFVLVFGLIIAVAHGAHEMKAPLSTLDIAPVTLDPRNLPEYALRTTMRMFAAIFASLLFTFMVATLAAKSRKAELVIIPALDILQSVPVLGFLTFTVVFFMGLFPGSQLGAECAAIFAVFTAQAWNMTFSFYQSLRTIPSDLDEVCRHFQLSPWLRFVRLEVPFAAPGLIWNTMMSMSGAWFFVVASEAIMVGDTTVRLPGIGSWIAIAIEQQNIAAVVLAVLTMAIVILAYDQFVFRPIVAWADKFRFEQTAAQQRPQSWLYDLIRRARLLNRISASLTLATGHLTHLPAIRIPDSLTRSLAKRPRLGRTGDTLWLAAVLAVTGYALWSMVDYVRATIGPADVLQALGYGFLTLLRVVILIAIASVIWVPIGVWIGLRPWAAERAQPIAQFLAAFPANVLFPIAVVGIVSLRLDPNIWLSPLMVLGTQWYILFNVVAGASAFPTDLREASTIYRLRSWQWWRDVMLPGIFPYYVTGALTASGGSWNASIVAEVATWGDIKLKAAGLGAYIADATEAGDFPRVVLGIAVMSIFVVTFNRLLWRPLFGLAERRFRLN